jgi:hypothetical protein
MPRNLGPEEGRGRPDDRRPERELTRSREEPIRMPLRGPNPFGAAIPSTLLGRDPGEGRIQDVPLGGRSKGGPKGWRRTDDRILDELAEAIARSGVDASQVEVTVQDGVVRVAGTVEHREDRRMIEDLARDVHGVRDVEERVRVRRPH